MEDVAQAYHMDQFLREFLQSNPIGSIVDTEDPSTNDLKQIERFLTYDGLAYMEVD